MPSPWLCPKAKCVGPEDAREEFRFNVGKFIVGLCVSWSNEIVYVAAFRGIDAWLLIEQEPLLKITVPEEVYCIALSEAEKIIVSGHFDGTLRQWDTDLGASIGESMKGHRSVVSSVASKGSPAVSGAPDGKIRMWNLSTGNTIGNALRAHTRL